MDNIRDPLHQNFVSIYHGFSYVAEKLEPYTKQGLDSTYQSIYLKVAGKPPCHQQCSNVHRGQTSKWCPTCSAWRNYLVKSRRSHYVSWEKTHSWKWSVASQNIAEIYLPSSWQDGNTDLTDMSTACFIWENCNYAFKIRHSIIRRIREVRNKYFAHNPSLKASDVEKAQVFDVLQDLLKDPDVQGHINAGECINGLSKIESGDPTFKWLQDMQRRFDKHGASLAEIQRRLEQKSFLEAFFEKSKSFSKRVLTNLLNLWLKTRVWFVLIGVMLLIFWPTQRPTEVSPSSCVSELYRFPFKQDLPLMPYLSEHENLVGRKWLFKDLHKEIITSKNPKVKGLVLVAEMGYGKSAIVTELLCPRTNEFARTINEHITAFHICKFNVRSTHNAARFLRRLVGFFALKSPEYGNIISMLPDGSLLYDMDSCDKEPDACFDQGITIPLRQISDVQTTPWIVVVDGLDECENAGENQILSILSTRIKQLPNWLKFIFTSRNVTSLTMLRKTKIIQLLANNSKNIDDIKLFVSQSFSLDTRSGLVEDLVNRSEGNFMYIIQAAEWLIQNQGLPRTQVFPKELGDIYEMNFDRKFLKDNSYEVPKKILEIISSAINPVKKQEIFTILKSNNVIQNISEFDKHFQSLTFFLRTRTTVHISHQALYQWLISVKNENYRISLKEGHLLISRYLLRVIRDSHSEDFVDLAFHAAHSDDTTISKIFISSKLLDDEHAMNESLIHQLTWKTPSVKALKLLLYHFPDVNIINKGNVTPAFVACARGHVDQLKLLHKRGADLSFTVQGNFLISSKHVLQKIEQMKQRFYSGYSLLHIAAQHGHTKIVTFLVEQNLTLLNQTNTLGQNAADIACENGHLDVLKILFSINPSVSGYKCLFYAAKNNHLIVVEWLVENGVNLNCVSERRSQKALTTIFNTQENTFPQAIFPNDTREGLELYPADAWWEIFKLNPVLVAIRMGSLDTAAYLINKFPGKLTCHDAFGYTAALTSVLYNRTDLLPLFKKQLVSDKCAKIGNNAQILTPYISEDIDTTVCPEGGGLAHVVALSNLGEIILYCLKEGLDIKWNKQDKVGTYPIHYAAAKTNHMFKVLFKELNFSNEDTRASNGSTPLHVAALTGQLAFVSYFTNSLKLSIPDITDKRGRGLLHYVVLRKFPDKPLSDSVPLYVQLKLFKYFSQICDHNLYSMDEYGRNILHYALRFGHYRIVRHITDDHRYSFNALLKQKDKMGNSPFAFAVEDYMKETHVMFHPHTCSFLDAFTPECLKSINIFEIASPWEIGLLSLVELVSSSEYISFMQPHLGTVMAKSPYLLTKILMHQDNDNFILLKRLLINTHKDGPFIKWSHLVIARFAPKAFHVCGQTLSQSPLHYLLLNSEYQSSIFTYHHSFVDFFLSSVFGTPLNLSFFSCADRAGYNIFHYALIGGNVLTAQILMRQKIRITNKKVSIIDVYSLVLFSRQVSNTENFINCDPNALLQSQEDCSDIFLQEYFELKRNEMMPRDFCINGTSELSLVHVLAANGMHRTLKAVANAFGREILSCVNRHGITPLYLSKLFNETATADFVGTETELVLPKQSAEEWLVMSILHIFPGEAASNSLFCLSQFASDHRVSFRQILKEVRCIAGIVDMFFPIGDADFIWTRLHIAVVVEKMQDLMLLLHSFEFNCLHGHNSTCIDCHFHIRQIYVTLVVLYQLYKQETQFKTSFDSVKLSRKLILTFDVILRQSMTAVKMYLKLLPSDTCTGKEITWARGKFNYMSKAAVNIVCRFRKWLKDAAYLLLLHGKKSVEVYLPETYTFLRARAHDLKFATVIPKPRSSAKVIEIDSAHDFNKYSYLKVIKSTFVYKKLKTVLRAHYFMKDGLFEEVQVKTRAIIELQEPFKELRKFNIFR